MMKAKDGQNNACFPASLPLHQRREYRRRSANFGGTDTVPYLNFPFYLRFDHATGTLCAGGNLQVWTIKTMTIGTVKFFNQTKGFGFISPEDGSKDVFVHISAVEQSGMSTLSEGQKVEFEVQPEARGPKAVNLQDA